MARKQTFTLEKLKDILKMLKSEGYTYTGEVVIGCKKSILKKKHHKIERVLMLFSSFSDVTPYYFIEVSCIGERIYFYGKYSRTIISLESNENYGLEENEEVPIRGFEGEVINTYQLFLKNPFYSDIINEVWDSSKDKEVSCDNSEQKMEIAITETDDFSKFTTDKGEVVGNEVLEQEEKDIENSKSISEKQESRIDDVAICTELKEKEVKKKKTKKKGNYDLLDLKYLEKDSLDYKKNMLIALLKEFPLDDFIEKLKLEGYRITKIGIKDSVCMGWYISSTEFYSRTRGYLYTSTYYSNSCEECLIEILITQYAKSNLKIDKRIIHLYDASDILSIKGICKYDNIYRISNFNKE